MVATATTHAPQVDFASSVLARRGWHPCTHEPRFLPGGWSWLVSELAAILVHHRWVHRGKWPLVWSALVVNVRIFCLKFGLVLGQIRLWWALQLRIISGLLLRTAIELWVVKRLNLPDLLQLNQLFFEHVLLVFQNNIWLPNAVWKLFKFFLA